MSGALIPAPALAAALEQPAPPVVLDGGLPAWVRAGYPLARAAPAVTPGDFEARPGGLALLAAPDAARIAREGVLLDARAPERFRGEHEPIDARAGHVPGAVNLPADRTLDADGRLRDADALRQAFARAGLRDGVPVGAYCGSGVSAALMVLALAQAGYGAGLYVGSWSEWIEDPRRPLATCG